MSRLRLFLVSAVLSTTISINYFQSLAIAQIRPDTTLPSNSKVNNINQTTLIDGGTEVGINLFHSFREFSVSSGRTAHFLNKTAIKNIITRISGNSVSSVNGIVKANGSANLFLLNPNGIIFGPNSQLNIGGSFVATTANRINFSSVDSFGVGKHISNSSLSSSQPTSLSFNQSSGPIQVLGPGHNLKLLTSSTVTSPIDDPPIFNTPLQTLPSKTLALLGGDIKLDGGILSAPSGNLVISSIKEGEVNLSFKASNPLFNHDNVIRYSDINFNNASLARTTGFGLGKIDIYGSNLALNNRSLVLNTNYSNIGSGNIDINLTGDLLVRGNTEPSSLIPLFSSGFIPFGGIVSQNFASENGPNINLDFNNLSLDDFGSIFSSNFSSGFGGDINLSAKDDLSITGSSPIPLSFFPSFITTSTVGGDAGNIVAKGKSLNITDGGFISSNTLGLTGNSGSINVNFKAITISGGIPAILGPGLPINFSPSFIGTTISFSQGSAGNISLKSSVLNLLNGGRINSTTISAGSAGDILINVDKSLVVSGRIPGSNSTTDNSQIISSAEKPTPLNRDLFQLPDLPTGKSGSITINSRLVTLKNGGQITVKNDGPNNAGQITIVAKNIKLFNGGSITSSTNGGDGGNIILNASFVLLKDALLSASALKLGNGGNISADANLFVALGESSLTAEAEKGQGGNITIAGKAVFLGPDVDVSVSSDAGLQASGTFKIVVEETDLDEATAPAPDVVTTPKVSSVCNPSGKVSEFVVLGSGGLQEDIQSERSKDLEWEMGSSNLITAHSNTESPKALLVEAKGWQRLDDHRIRLTANAQDSSNKVAAHPTPCNQSS